MGIKISSPIAEILKKYRGDKDFRESIVGSAIVLQFVKDKGIEDESWVDEELVGLLKKKYKGLTLDMLVALWVDNYDTSRFDTEPKYNRHKVFVMNKVVAIGQIIHEKYMVDTSKKTNNGTRAKSKSNSNRPGSAQ